MVGEVPGIDIAVAVRLLIASVAQAFHHLSVADQVGREVVIVHRKDGSVLRIGIDDASNLTYSLGGKVAQQGT